MIEILEKTSKENQIPVSAIEVVFGDSNKTAYLLNLLGGGNNNRQSQEIENVQKTIKPRR
jgi:hypothetical protein